MNLKGVFAGVLLSLALLFTSGSAGAAVKPAATSVCDTSGRGDAVYERLCMRKGTLTNSAALWLAVPVGKKGKQEDGAYNRRSVCEYAGGYGGIRTSVRELFFDIAYDHFHNHERVLKDAGTIARVDCNLMGYRV